MLDVLFGFLHVLAFVALGLFLYLHIKGEDLGRRFYGWTIVLAMLLFLLGFTDIVTSN